MVYKAKLEAKITTLQLSSAASWKERKDSGGLVEVHVEVHEGDKAGIRCNRALSLRSGTFGFYSPYRKITINRKVSRISQVPILGLIQNTAVHGV